MTLNARAQARVGLEGLTDSEIAARIAAGDTELFTSLMRRSNRKLYRAARAITGDGSEAEDVVQETWTRAYAAFANFRGEASLETWLVRIALNEAMGRKRRARPTVELDESVESQTSSIVSFPVRSSDPEALFLRGQMRVRLEKAVDALPPAFRSVLVLRLIEDLSSREVATQLAIPEATVKTRLHRARAMLRSELERDFGAILLDAFPFDGANCERLTRRVLARIVGAPGAPSS